MDSETGWTGELWSKPNLLNWQILENSLSLANKKIFLKCSDLKKKRKTILKFLDFFFRFFDLLTFFLHYQKKMIFCMNFVFFLCDFYGTF